MNRHKAAFELAAEHGGGLLRFSAWGRSMWPLLRPGDTAIAEPLEGAPRDGDVLVYRAGDRLVAHRLIGRLPDGRLRLHGDFTLDEDAPLAPPSALGRVVAVERAGRRIALDAGIPRLLAFLLPPLRRRAPGLVRAIRAAAGRVVEWTDLSWTAAPLRRVRRRAAPALTIAIAASADAAELEAFDRARGRPDCEYHHLAPGEFVVVARIEDRIVGCTHVIDPHWTAAVGLAGDLWIHDTHVARRWRGLGIGRAVSRAALDELHRRGVRRVRVAIGESNARSRVLYQSLGFARVGYAGGHDLFELVLAPPQGLG